MLQDTQDLQKFLETVTQVTYSLWSVSRIKADYVDEQDHGAARIEYILTYPTVISRPQNQRDAISFAATYLGCLSV